MHLHVPVPDCLHALLLPTTILTRSVKIFYQQSLCGLRTEVSKIDNQGITLLLPAPLSGLSAYPASLYYGWTFVQFSPYKLLPLLFFWTRTGVIGKQSLLTATIPNFTSGMFIMILFLLDFLFHCLF